MTDQAGALSRRAIGKAALYATGGLVAGQALAVLPDRHPAVAAPGRIASAVAPPRAAPVNVVRPALLRRALAALAQHGARVPNRDRMMVVDFSLPSSQPRLHLVQLPGGRTNSLLVAHGSGSDPAHSGWCERFSNDPGSNASCQGAFVTGDYYQGKHGRSQRLIGLDPTNSNTLERGIVIHAAWYANPEMIAEHGMLGRSQGCFAVGEGELDHLFAQLGPGRMIYADRA